MKQRKPLQIDLFTAMNPTPLLTPDLHKKLLPLIEALLMEVMAEMLTLAEEENGDDEDLI